MERVWAERQRKRDRLKGREGEREKERELSYIRSH